MHHRVGPITIRNLEVPFANNSMCNTFASITEELGELDATILMKEIPLVCGNGLGSAVHERVKKKAGQVIRG